MNNLYVLVAVLVCAWMLPRNTVTRYEFTCNQCLVVIPVFENINVFSKPANAAKTPTYVHVDTAHIISLP